MKKQTRCIVRHEWRPDGTVAFPGSVPPIDPSTAFHHLEGEAQPYPRYFNTGDQARVAQLIADLEQAEAGLLFSSGMAAITTTLRTLLPPGAHAVFLEGLYGGTQALVATELALSNQFAIDASSQYTNSRLSKKLQEKAVREDPSTICLKRARGINSA